MTNSVTTSNNNNDDGAVVGIGTEVAGMVGLSPVHELGVLWGPGIAVGAALNAACSHQICSCENGSGALAFVSNILIGTSQLITALSKDGSE